MASLVGVHDAAISLEGAQPRLQLSSCDGRKPEDGRAARTTMRRRTRHESTTTSERRERGLRWEDDHRPHPNNLRAPRRPQVIIAPDGGDAWEPAKPRPHDTLIRALAAGASVEKVAGGCRASGKSSARHLRVSRQAMLETDLSCRAERGARISAAAAVRKGGPRRRYTVVAGGRSASEPRSFPSTGQPSQCCGRGRTGLGTSLSRSPWREA